MYRYQYLASCCIGGFLIQLRKLEPDQFDVLKRIHEGFCPDSKTSIAVVAERDGEPVGRVFLLAPAHIEGPWVREDLRGSILGARLMKRAEEEALGIGITKLFAYSISDQLSDYLKRLGYKDERMTVWSKELCRH